MNTANLKSELMRIVAEIQIDWKIKWLIKVSKILKITPSKAAFTPPPITPEKEVKNKHKETDLVALMELARQPTPDTIDLGKVEKIISQLDQSIFLLRNSKNACIMDYGRIF
ncbi:MAG: hypothetical protein AB8G86_00930 [Saprospiraceae bacterium]